MDSIMALFEKIDFAALWKQIESFTGTISVDQVIAALTSFYTLIVGLFK